MASHVEMLRLLFAEGTLDISEIRVQPAGIHLKLGTDECVSAAVRLAARETWIVTKQNGRSVAIEPRYTPKAPILPGTRLYHVSDQTNREAIAASGLSPMTGGNTTFNRSYPARLHLSSKLGDALAFVHHQVSAPASGNFRDGKFSPRGGVAGPRSIDALDLYQAAAPAGVEFYNDSHMVGGLWTEASIGPEGVSIVDRDFWLPTYNALYPPPPPIEEALSALLVREDEDPATS